MRALLLLLASGCAIEHGLNKTPDVPPGDDTGSPPADTDVDDSCAGFAPRAVEAPPIDATCEAEPEVGTFNPIVEWLWDTNPLVPGYEQVMATPVVGNLTDDDGDGDIDADDIPDIAFTAYAGGNYGSAGVLTVISGDGAGTHWSLTSAGGHGFYGSGGVAIADVDADGSPDVCAAATTAGVVCLEADGTFKWQGGTAVDAYGYPSVADLDADGRPEVIWGREIIDSGGRLVATGAYGTGSNGYASTSFAVDVDGDGFLEVVAGNAVYERDGTALWYDGGPDGWPAVGDFDGDGAPEIVRVSNGYVYLSDGDG
ncbi:MAG: FG-GAP repeat domain-containing protein, partial [Myxococcota bacterium]